MPFTEPTNVHYHMSIHITQLRSLAALTGEGIFTATGDRWEKYAASARWRAQLTT
jgi:hypothetical protein